MKKCIYKVPNGKLLKLFLVDTDNTISSVKITGDFFLYPEENLEALEQKLQGVEKTEEPLRGAIGDFLTENPTIFFGLDTEALVYALMNAQ